MRHLAMKTQRLEYAQMAPSKNSGRTLLWRENCVACVSFSLSKADLLCVNSHDVPRTLIAIIHPNSFLSVQQ